MKRPPPGEAHRLTSSPHVRPPAVAFRLLQCLSNIDLCQVIERGGVLERLPDDRPVGRATSCPHRSAACVASSRHRSLGVARPGNSAGHRRPARTDIAPRSTAMRAVPPTELLRNDACPGEPGRLRHPAWGVKVTGADPFVDDCPHLRKPSGSMHGCAARRSSRMDSVSLISMVNAARVSAASRRSLTASDNLLSAEGEQHADRDDHQFPPNRVPTVRRSELQ